MNTHADLESELNRLAAECAPSAERIRRDLDGRQQPRSTHRGTTAWIAVAASVAVVAGGVGITAGLVQHHRTASAASHSESNAPASDETTVPDRVGDTAPDGGAALIPEVDGLTAPTSAVPTTPTGTSATSAALVPVSPDTVTTPVTARAPEGLSGPIWQRNASALAVKFIDADAFRQVREYAMAHPDAGEPPMRVREVGYVVTSDRDGQLRTFGASDTAAPGVTRRDYPIAGHDATLETAPPGVVGAFDTSAVQRLTWQLPDGRWIHVYSTGENSTQLDVDTPSAALETFAAGITNEPQSLAYGITVGLTLPGLNNVSRSEDLSDPDKFHSDMTLCPDGFDPTGAAAQGATDLPCVTAAVLRDTLSGNPSAKRDPGTVVVSGGLAVHIVAWSPGNHQPAWALPADGLVLWFTVPSSAALSNEQYAELVASVQLSPEVLMLASSSDPAT